MLLDRIVLTSKNLQVAFLAAFSLIAFGYEDVISQVELLGNDKSAWSVFAPDGKGFQIELPGVPKQTPKHNPGKTDESEYFRCTKSLDSAYKLVGNGIVEIGIFDITKCSRKTTDFERETIDLVRSFSADDENDRITRDEKKTIDGFPTRLFVVRTGAGRYISQIFVEAKGRMYWVSYATYYRVESLPAEAERILNSFKILSYVCGP